MTQQSQSVAVGSDLLDGWSFAPPPPEKRQELPPIVPVVAGIATVAGPGEVFPWSDGLRRLETMPRPNGIGAEKWDELVNEAGLVSRTWGKQAIANGWEPLDLFGCNPNPLARRVDRNGLVATLVNFLTPLRIVDVTDKCAILTDLNGAILRHHRGGRSGQALLWEAYAVPTGP